MSDYDATRHGAAHGANLAKTAEVFISEEQLQEEMRSLAEALRQRLRGEAHSENAHLGSAASVPGKKRRGSLHRIFRKRRPQS
jgi:hypothetical protein